MTFAAQDAASWLANPRATRETLEAFGLATKHRLGQNFLVEDNIIRKIIRLAELTSDDVVLEVGPGLGTLTFVQSVRLRLTASLRVCLQQRVKSRIKTPLFCAWEMP